MGVFFLVYRTCWHRAAKHEQSKFALPIVCPWSNAILHKLNVQGKPPASGAGLDRGVRSHAADGAAGGSVKLTNLVSGKCSLAVARSLLTAGGMLSLLEFRWTNTVLA